jgi:hypothetical protein
VSEVAKRNARNRGAGKRWEKEIEDGGRALGIDTDRTRDTGTKDQGDLVMRVDGGKFVVIEAKNAKFEPGPFVEEALVEAKHFAEFRKLDASRVHPVVFVKRRGKNFLDSFALITVREYLRLVSQR